MNSSNFISILKSNSMKKQQEGRIGDAVRLIDSFLQLIQLKEKVTEHNFGVVQPGGILHLVFKYLSHRKTSPLQKYRQNDAMECLGVFLDAFEEATENSIQDHWQSGKVRRRIIDHKDKVTKDETQETQIAWNIQIPNQRDPVNLEECIRNTYDGTVETVHYKRDGDTEAKDYDIIRNISSTPSIWVLTLSRWDMMQNKINTPIIIPLKLKQSNITYSLKGIICHSGSSIPSGHYYSVVVKSKDTLVLIDDDCPRKITVPIPQQILRQAYGIVYEKNS